MVKTAYWPKVKKTSYISHDIQDDLIAFLSTTDAIDILTGPDNYFWLIKRENYSSGRTKEQRPYIMFNGFKVILIDKETEEKYLVVA